MKTILSIQFALHVLFFGDFSTITLNDLKNMEQTMSPYYKWGQTAIQKTKEKYPQATIIDYFHIGRVSIKDYSIEKFKLWLKDNNKEFGVYVDVKLDNKTEQIIDIKFKETTK
ncbi:DUF3889 domain-containing protein [Rummeliibacillus pycnus]|uniref:DUF3889 domain-containing protein n=1 Tax=Rummeliibacillus pycnus TaxID=101070 RepID=UPI003D2C2ADA